MEYNKKLRDYYLRFGMIGERLLESDRVSESDLLRAIPNNYKRLHGMPLLRLNGKRKTNLKKHSIDRLTNALFPIVTEMMESEISKRFPDLFSLFADIHDIKKE